MGYNYDSVSDEDRQSDEEQSVGGEMEW